MTTKQTEVQPRELAYWAAHLEALRQEMQRDPTIVVMGEDVAGGAGRQDQGIIDAWGGPYGTTRGLIKEFGPERVRDTPISEAGFIGTAVGMAMAGMRPWVELMYSSFVGVSLDQFINASWHRYKFGRPGNKVSIPLVVKTWINRSEGVHYSLLTNLPGLKVVVPSDPYTVKGLLTASLRDDSPVVFFDHLALLRMKAPVPEESYTLPLGKSRILQEGTDVTIIGMSAMTQVCNEAAKLLAEDGISAEVVDLLSLQPLDEDCILSSVQKTGKLVIVDEGFPRCSVARDIAGMVADQAFDFLNAPIKCVMPPPTWKPSAPNLEEYYLPTPAKVVAAVKGIL